MVGWLREREGDWNKKGREQGVGMESGRGRTWCGGLGVKRDGECEVGIEGGGG